MIFRDFLLEPNTVFRHFLSLLLRLVVGCWGFFGGCFELLLIVWIVVGHCGLLWTFLGVVLGYSGSLWIFFLDSCGLFCIVIDRYRSFLASESTGTHFKIANLRDFKWLLKKVFAHCQQICIIGNLNFYTDMHSNILVFKQEGYY